MGILLTATVRAAKGLSQVKIIEHVPRKAYSIMSPSTRTPSPLPSLRGGAPDTPLFQPPAHRLP